MPTPTRCCFISAARSHQRWRRNIQNIPPDRRGGRPRWQAAGRQVLCLMKHASSCSPTPPLPLSLEQLFFKRSLAVSRPPVLLTDSDMTHWMLPWAAQQRLRFLHLHLMGIQKKGDFWLLKSTWLVRIRWTQSTFLFSTLRDLKSSSWTKQESLWLAWCPH